MKEQKISSLIKNIKKLSEEHSLSINQMILIFQIQEFEKIKSALNVSGMANIIGPSVAKFLPNSIPLSKTKNRYVRKCLTCRKKELGVESITQAILSLPLRIKINDLDYFLRVLKPLNSITIGYFAEMHYEGLYVKHRIGSDAELLKAVEEIKLEIEANKVLIGEDDLCLCSAKSICAIAGESLPGTSPKCSKSRLENAGFETCKSEIIFDK